MVKRPPIITVVGHIDHGKSALLDALRKTNKERKEQGDITQHIGAYQINKEYEGEDRHLTIIDTPGHSAFAHIREHGVDIADIALLVVSTEEGWKEQTKEAYAVLEEKKIPYIVVFTKMDTEKSDLERTKIDVLSQGVMLEKLGGSIPWIETSSKTGQNLEELTDLILLVSDLNETGLSDEDDGSIGITVEADVDEKIGITATIIVKKGKVETGDYLRVSEAVSPIRILKNSNDEKIEIAIPSTPIRVSGFDKIPEVGEKVYLYKNKKEALKATVPFLDKGVHRLEEKPANSIPLILKADTTGSLQSLVNLIKERSSENVKFYILKEKIGLITENDLYNAMTHSDVKIIGFHTKLDPKLAQKIDNYDVKLNLFNTIYEVSEYIDELLLEEQKVLKVKEHTGVAKVIRIFESNKESGIYIVGAEILEGSFSVEQEIMARKNDKETGFFQITNLEKKNKKTDRVEEKKTQFAVQIKGKGEIEEGQEIIALGSKS